jgi:hypothetical protein
LVLIMAISTRHKNTTWTIPNNANGTTPYEGAQLAVLMDIRDELQSLVRLANCYRIPRALDAMIELGAEARRKKRALAKRRKVARARV